MMTIEEIQTRKESQTFDCKSIQIDPKALAIPIVAMANADGGVLAIGVSDKTRKIEGVDGNEERLNELLRVPFDFCNPSVKVRCEYLPCTNHEGRGTRILLMYIPASVQLHTNQADECFMRVGDKSKKLNFDERMQLFYDKGERYYEDKDVYGATIDDIDMNLVDDYRSIVGYGKSGMEYLRENNEFITEIDGKQKISTACILLFGKNPQRFFPRARTRFIRYEGNEEKVGREMNVVKDVTFEGAILQQVRSTIDYLETQVREHSFLGEHGQFVTRRNYSKYAIQEMVVNSCCHRAYNIKGTEIQIKMFDDRLVFETPGDLPGLVRPDNIRHTHFSRNPKIAQYLKAYKYVKEFGEGIDRICNELETKGCIIPSFHVDAFILKAILKAEWTSEKEFEHPNTDQKDDTINGTVKISKMTDRQCKIYEIIKNGTVNDTVNDTINDTINAMTLSEALNMSIITIKRDLYVLRDMNLIRYVGSNKTGHWEIIENKSNH